MKISTKFLIASLLSLFIVPSVSFAASVFSDVKEDDFGYHAISYLKGKDILEGYPDATFKPNKKINRAEFLKIVMEASVKRGITKTKIEGANCFSDVKDQWFAPYVCTAHDLGIVSGYLDGSFHPEQTINFVEASKIIVNSFQLKIEAEKYKDSWYQPFVVALANREAIPDTILNFEYYVSRADMACMATVVMGAGIGCGKTLNYPELVGVSFLKKPVKLSADGYVDVKFYKAKGKVHIVDLDGSVYTLEDAIPDQFKNLAGTSYTDGQYVFAVSANYKAPVQVSYLTQMDLGFDLATIERLKEGDAKDWFFLRDKNNLYTSCGYSDPKSFQIVKDFDKDNFKILVDNPDYAYFTDSKHIYKATHEKPTTDSQYYCKVEVMNDDFNNYEWIYPKSAYEGNQAGNGIAFVKDKNHIYNLLDLSVLDWANPESFRLWSLKYGTATHKMENYYIQNDGKVWFVDANTGDYLQNQEMDGATLSFANGNSVITRGVDYEIDSETLLRPGRCEYMKEFFAGNTEIALELDHGTGTLQLTDNGECIVNSTQIIDPAMGIYTYLMKDKNNFWLFNPVSRQFDKFDLGIIKVEDNAEALRIWEYDEEGFQGVLIF